MGPSKTAALITACKEALEADNVFTGEGTLARRKIRDAVEDLDNLAEAKEKAPAPTSSRKPFGSSS